MARTIPALYAAVCLFTLISCKPSKNDLASGLTSIQKELSNPGVVKDGSAPSVEAKLKALCKAGTAFPKCRQWALGIAEKLRDDDDSLHLISARIILGTIRQLQTDAGTPATVDSATLDLNFAQLENKLGNRNAALVVFRTSFQTFVKLLGPNHPKTFYPLFAMAEAYVSNSNLKQAEPLLNQALALSRISGVDTFETSDVLNDLGELYELAGDYTKAERALQESLKIRRALPNKDPQAISESLNNLGELYEPLGDYSKAKLTFAEALEVLPQASRETLTAAAIHNNLGEAAQTLGDFSTAEREYAKTLDLMQRLRGPRNSDTAIALGNLASLYSQEGAYDKALELRLQALDIEHQNEPDSLNAAGEYNNLGVLYYLRGEYKKAEENYRKALAIRQRIERPDHLDIAANLDNLAVDLVAEGRLDQAEPMCLQALHIREKTGRPMDLALSLHHLGNILVKEGRYDKGLRDLLRALKIHETSFLPGHPETIATRRDYARDLWLLGRHRDARDQMITANREVSVLWSRTLTAVGDARRRSFTHEFDDLTNTSLSMAVALAAEDRQGAASLAALAIATRKGARSSASKEIFTRVRAGGDPEALGLLRKLSVLLEQESSLRQKGSEGSPEKLAALSQQENETEKLLIEKSGAYRNWRMALEPSRVTAGVPQGAAFVDILRYRRTDWTNWTNQEPHYAAMVYMSGGPPALVPLGPADAIDSAIALVRSNFENIWRLCTRENPCPAGVDKTLKTGPDFQANLERTKENYASLYALTMLKLEPAIHGAKRLMISPDAALAEIPWEAMRDRTEHYLVEQGYRITYLDSARTLAYFPPPAQPRTPAVVLAGMDYDGKPAVPVNTAASAKPPDPVEEMPAGGATGKWKPLQGSTEVLEAIRELNQAGKIGRIEKLPLGSEDEVVALQRPAALIAYTHGFFSLGASENDEGIRSGIVLYGANHASETDLKGHDGLLMANEAMLLDLEGTRLVALFGCDTGRGVEAGEGVQGFRHALSVAGARATLLTLWEVGDLSTARVLREFLARTAPPSGTTMEEALAATQLAFIRGDIQEPNATANSNRWRHPYFWAAATLSGQDATLTLASQQ
ncbi:MAG TPA: CHAT domain-containing tetratricopeptide repeat protein [Bryobacteraceae bacterium]|nr:CHAT domain-containing tetratricopeptide repeat protein [Bryobacteraceae bacterium]